MIPLELMDNIKDFNSEDVKLFKELNPVKFEFNNGISTREHVGFVDESTTIKEISEVIPYTVAAIKDVYSILDKKFYELPFTADDLIPIKYTIENGKTLTGALDKIISLSPILDSSYVPNLLSQQVHAIIPELELEHKQKKTIDYLSLIIYLCAAIKELKQQVDFLSKKK